MLEFTFITATPYDGWMYTKWLPNGEIEILDKGNNKGYTNGVGYIRLIKDWNTPIMVISYDITDNLSKTWQELADSSASVIATYKKD